MEEKRLEICRFCQECIGDTSFVVQEDRHAEMLRLLLVELNSSVSYESIICSICARNLQKCYDFKLACLTTEDSIKTFAVDQDTLKVNLQDIVLHKFSDKFVDVAECQYICRLCFNLDSEIFTKLDHSDLKSMLRRCIPEVNLNLTNNPVICSFCLDLLKQALQFTQANVLKLDPTMIKVETFTDELKPQLGGLEIDNCITSGFMKEHSDEVKMENDFLCEEVELKCEPEEVKSEPGEGKYAVDSDSELYELRDKNLPQMQSYEKKYNKDRQKKTRTFPCKICSISYSAKYLLANHKFHIHGEASQIRLYKCDLCIYTSRHKYRLTQHGLVHKSFSETTVFKCSDCPFRTKYKLNLKGHLFTNHLDTYMLIYQSNSGVQMYNCAHCTYKTADKRHMSYHVMTHRDKSELITYDCFHCTYRAIRKSHLRRHLITHRCKICGRQFPRRFLRKNQHTCDGH